VPVSERTVWVLNDDNGWDAIDVPELAVEFGRRPQAPLCTGGALLLRLAPDGSTIRVRRQDDGRLVNDTVRLPSTDQPTDRPWPAEATTATARSSEARIRTSQHRGRRRPAATCSPATSVTATSPPSSELRQERRCGCGLRADADRPPARGFTGVQRGARRRPHRRVVPFVFCGRAVAHLDRAR